jgi:putative hemolysin
MSTGATTITRKTIDIDEVFRKKNPKLYRWIPRFLLRYLKRIVHQDEINEFLWNARDCYGLEMVAAIVRRFDARIEVVGVENIPQDGRFVIAANHPLGGLDGIALMHVIGQYLPGIVFPVNDILMNLPNFGDLFLPVNKHGMNKQLTGRLDEAFASGKTVLYFPAGLCSRKGEEGICDLDWKKTFVTKARQFDRQIIPVHIEGRNSNWFYNLARFRTRLGIKANLEMLYLADEMFRQKGKTIKFTIGTPIDISKVSKTVTDLQLAKQIKSHVYELGKNKIAHFSI